MPIKMSVVLMMLLLAVTFNACTDAEASDEHYVVEQMDCATEQKQLDEFWSRDRSNMKQSEYGMLMVEIETTQEYLRKNCGG